MPQQIIKFSEYFNLNKSQYELDFVDIPINNGDVPLFIDPYAISKRTDYWSIDCHNAIVDFFQYLIDQISQGNTQQAREALAGLREPNQTRLGMSTGNKPRGRGVGTEQSEFLFLALSGSTAVRTGFIKDLEECELLIEGIGRDKISDIATNIIRHKLIEYTQIQCELWNIPLNSVPSGMTWNQDLKEWENEYVNLPVCNSNSVILIPKAIARFDIEFDYQEYYQHFVLNFLQSEELSANSSLVRTLKDGTKKPPYKKVLEEKYPLSKKYLYEFSKEHPDILSNYKTSKNYNLKELNVEDILFFAYKQETNRSVDYNTLKNKLKTIQAGDSAANQYHDYIIGAMTAIFYPYIINPKKEQEIHDGRKRIDIVFQNSAQDGFFFELPNTKSVPSGYIFVECKNYASDPANPALDKLSGRFSTNRGKFGFLVCRSFSNKDLFIQRCKDTAQDDRGFIVALDDDDIEKLLEFRSNNNYAGINTFLDDRYQELVM